MAFTKITDTGLNEVAKLTQLKYLYLSNNQLADVTGLEKLTQLKKLYLGYTPDLTKAQIDELQKALPKCKIETPSPSTNSTRSSQVIHRSR